MTRPPRPAGNPAAAASVESASGRADNPDPEALESTDFVGALTALGLYLDAAERLARSRTATPKLREALTAAKQELQTVVRLHMARRGAADS